MAQGSRGGWVRAAFTGLGIVLCTGTMGCMNTDKDKLPPKIGANGFNKQPSPGLPGTTTLPGGSGVGSTKTGQPNYNNYGGTGMQPTGGFGSGSPSIGGKTTYGSGTGYGTGSGGSGGFGSGGAVPSMGAGAMPGGAAEFGAGSASPSYGYKDSYKDTYGGAASPGAPNLGVPSYPNPPAPPGGYGGGDVSPPSAPLAPGLKPPGY